MNLKISDIKIGQHVRDEFGDIDASGESLSGRQPNDCERIRSDIVRTPYETGRAPSTDGQMSLTNIGRTLCTNTFRTPKSNNFKERKV